MGWLVVFIIVLLLNSLNDGSLNWLVVCFEICIELWSAYVGGWLGDYTAFHRIDHSRFYLGSPPPLLLIR